jgi:hypothetical protein
VALPKGRLNTAKVELSGGEVEICGLNLAQSRAAGKLQNEARIIAAISYATGDTRAEVKEWLETAPAGDATKLLNAITEVSGLGEGAQFPQ